MGYRRRENWTHGQRVYHVAIALGFALLESVVLLTLPISIDKLGFFF